MRVASFLIISVIVAVTACATASRTATTPDVRETAPGPLVLINGLPLAAGHRLKEISPKAIVSVEVVKGEAARRFGPGAVRGVIFITVSDSALAARLTRP